MAKLDVEYTPWQNTRQDGAIASMHIRAVLAQNLRLLRKERGFSQEELALRADIDRTYISSLERAVYGATIDMVDRLAKVLGVPASDLLRVPDEARTDF